MNPNKDKPDDICPFCGKRRWWGKPAKDDRTPMRSWGCEGGCIGISFTLDFSHLRQVDFEIASWVKRIQLYGREAIPKA